jgi:hypothetical protein
MDTTQDLDLITTEEAAAILKFSPSTLRKWKMEKRNLPVYSLSRKATRYHKPDVLAFAAAHRNDPQRGLA